MVDTRDDAYRAIGRYVGQFSMLVSFMRNMLASRIAGQGGEGNERELVDLAFGSLTAEPIANAFFAMCRVVVKLDKGEQAIEANLRKAVLAEIKRRNDIVHGDWLIDPEPEPGRPSSILIRVKAGSVKKPFSFTRYEPAQIEDMCAEVEALRNVVWEFAAVITRLHEDDTLLGPLPARVRDALHIVNGRVTFRPGIAIRHWIY